MKRKRFSEEQIIRILYKAETLDNVREMCRQHNIAELECPKTSRPPATYCSIQARHSPIVDDTQPILDRVDTAFYLS